MFFPKHDSTKPQACGRDVELLHPVGSHLTRRRDTTDLLLQCCADWRKPHAAVLVYRLQDLAAVDLRVRHVSQEAKTYVLLFIFFLDMYKFSAYIRADYYILLLMQQNVVQQHRLNTHWASGLHCPNETLKILSTNIVCS